MHRKIRCKTLWIFPGIQAARIVHEPEPGLTPARLRAIAEVESDVIIFVDDDNVLDHFLFERVHAYRPAIPLFGGLGRTTSSRIRNTTCRWIG